MGSTRALDTVNKDDTYFNLNRECVKLDTASCTSI